jgi:prepilin-type processing-associated H-X9-DG protein
MQNHVNALRVFPTGGTGPNPFVYDYTSGPKINATTGSGSPNGPGKQGLGWAYQILPYLEQGAVRGLVSQLQIQEQTIPGYYCPSRRSAEKVAGATGITVLMDYAAATPTSFKCGNDFAAGGKYDLNVTTKITETGGGNAGYNEAVKSFWCGAGNNGQSPAHNSFTDGVIVRTPWRLTTAASTSSPGKGQAVNGGSVLVEPGKVSDGLSNTLLVSEKIVRSDLYAGNLTEAGGSSWSDDRGWSDGFDPDTMRLTGVPPLSDGDGFCFAANTDQYCTGNGVEVLFFGSGHASGINAVFADGSVHHLRYDIDRFLFNALGTRNGEETVDASQL